MDFYKRANEFKVKNKRYIRSSSRLQWSGLTRKLLFLSSWANYDVNLGTGTVQLERKVLQFFLNNRSVDTSRIVQP